MTPWNLSSPNATSLVLKGKEAKTLSYEARIYKSEVLGVSRGGGCEVGGPAHSQRKQGQPPDDGCSLFLSSTRVGPHLSQAQSSLAYRRLKCLSAPPTLTMTNQNESWEKVHPGTS